MIFWFAVSEPASPVHWILMSWRLVGVCVSPTTSSSASVWDDHRSTHHQDSFPIAGFMLFTNRPSLCGRCTMHMHLPCAFHICSLTRYDSLSDVGEIRVYQRADFQSGSRVLKKVFWTLSYLYLWHTMWFHAKKLLKTLKFWKSLNSLCKSDSRPQKSPIKAQERIAQSRFTQIFE